MTTSASAPVNAQVPLTELSMNVTGDHAGAGDAIAYSTACTMAYLENIGQWAIEYQVGSGEWSRLEMRNSTRLNIDMNATTIQVRKAVFSAAGQLRATFDGVPTGYTVDDNDPVDLGGGGATAFTQLKDAPGTLIPGALIMCNALGEELENSATLNINAAEGTVSVSPPDPDPEQFGSRLVVFGKPGGFDGSPLCYSDISTYDGGSNLDLVQGGNASFKIFLSPTETAMLFGPDTPWRLQGVDDTNGTAAVTFAATDGPGSAALSPKKWLKVRIGNTDGWIPWFSV